jgi:hypothetical protein
MNFDLIRSLVRRAASEAPFDVTPALPFLSIVEPTASEGLRMSVDIPSSEGEQFIHWRFLADLDLVRATHEGRPGIGRSGARIEGLSAKGQEFLELSGDDQIWDIVIQRCRSARALTYSNVVAELRVEGRRRISAQRKMAKE